MNDTQDFDQYVGARWPRLVRAAVLLGCPSAEAEDLVQTALMRCLVHWHKVARANDRDAYVHRVMVNTFLSSRRRRWSRELPTATLPEVAGIDETEAVDVADAVVRGLSRLGVDQRTVVVLRYYAQLDEQQMAAALGVPVGTVKSRLSRAVRALANDPHLAEL